MTSSLSIVDLFQGNKAVAPIFSLTGTLQDPTFLISQLSDIFSMSGSITGKPNQHVDSEILSMASSLTVSQVILLLKSTLTLLNSIEIGGTLSLVNSLNVEVAGDLTVLNNILQEISGTLTIRNDLDTLTKVNGTITLLNHILTDTAGKTIGKFVFDKQHGIV